MKSVRQLAGYSILTAVMFVTPLFVFLPAALFHAGIRHGRRLAWSALPIGAFLAALPRCPVVEDLPAVGAFFGGGMAVSA